MALDAKTEDAQDAATLEAFDREHGSMPFGPIAVIVPAYREAASIAGVLREIPRKVHERGVTVLVSVDGPDDGTGAIARDHGAVVCGTGLHRGQGAALRVGYRIAAARGAAFLVSIDADGQYVPEEIPAIVEPLLSGEADFVSGSRRLGSDGTADATRSLGVDVFARAISLLTGHRIIDPSFGVRAMTAQVANTVVLRQPQYQASELLIGAILHGFRVVERPGTIRLRTGAKSRKGRNLIYGLRFGRVVLATWWRDRAKLSRRRFD